MSQNSKVQIELAVKDNATAPIKRGYSAMSAEAKKAAQAMDAIGQKKGIIRQLADQSQKAAKGGDAIARAMQETAKHLSAATKDMKDFYTSMSKSRKEAEKTKTTMEKMKGLGGKALGAGKMAAGATVAGADGVTAILTKPMDYDLKNRHIANTMYSDKDLQGRLDGLKKIEDSIELAVKNGGGTREGAQLTLGVLAAGGMDEKIAREILPLIQKTATASDAEGKDIASMLMGAIGSGAINQNQAGEYLGSMMKAGQLGSFELKDLSKWSPKFTQAGAGMKDMEGMKQHAANIQGVRKVTASSDDAGNAYYNILGKLNAEETTRKFDEKYKTDLTKQLIDARAKGVDITQAFLDVIEKKVLSKSAEYQGLLKKYNAATDPKEKANLGQQLEISLQAELGTIIADREAMTGLYGLMTQKDTIAKVRSQIDDSAGVIDTSFDLITGSVSSGVDKLWELGKKYAHDALKGSEDTINAGINSILKVDSDLEKARKLEQDLYEQKIAQGGASAVSALGGKVAQTAEDGYLQKTLNAYTFPFSQIKSMTNSLFSSDEDSSILESMKKFLENSKVEMVLPSLEASIIVNLDPATVIRAVEKVQTVKATRQ